MVRIKTKAFTCLFVAIAVLVGLSGNRCFADLFTWTGPSSSGHTVSLEAELTITEGGLTDTLTVVVRNTTESYGGDVQVPSDVIGSFYFDITHDVTGLRPTLDYISATGDVYLKNTSPAPYSYIYDADIASPEDILTGGWDFHTTDHTSFPYMGFGIGTVGNNTSGIITDQDNQFQGSLVEGFNYSIYSSANPLNPGLQKVNLVEDQATFVFEGDLDEYSIVNVGWGLGTGPDSYVPTPGAVLLGILGLGAVGLKLRKYA